MDDTRVGSSDAAAIDRQMPSSREAEQCVLGSMLYDPQTINTATSMLVPDDFYTSVYKIGRAHV